MTAPKAADVRRWARAHGLQVGDRGRLAPHVLQAYVDAQGTEAEQAPRPSVRTVHAKPVWDWHRQ